MTQHSPPDVPPETAWPDPAQPHRLRRAYQQHVRSGNARPAVQGKYLLERALGGAAMVVAEPVPVHRTGVLTRGNLAHIPMPR
jgi:hypothetical protein